ncbi:hypothetical protein F0U60_03095 [Archangium minus]|uniref:TIGR04255 family protein n=1 Tax=Archangium minus TaxID=83450 RepID=A0ABY9WK53_9BACT|nr:hypothetical protein F0U60_03095 [Archangium minus]
MSRPCLLHKPPGTVVSFALIPEAEVPPAEELMRRALDVIEALAPVVRPLAVDLGLVCQTRGIPLFVPDVPPRVPAVHIREEVVPPRVSIESIYEVGSSFSVVPRLTRETLARWCADALAQEPPGPDYLVTFEELVCTQARARLFEEKPERGLTLRDGGGHTWEAPLELRHDGVWVAGPLEDRPMDAPASFRITNLEGRLDAHVQIGWALWDQPGTPEHQAMQEALKRIAAQGWTPQHVPSAFAEALR